MFRQLNFRSFFNFLGRNKLYAAINIFGLSVSLMFVILIADYTLRQLTCDDYHAKADRIYVIGNEERITSGYYLQKYLRDRYPEIESTCAVAVSGQSTDATQPVEVGLQKYSATILFADTTFFRIFDYQLLDGDREQVLDIFEETCGGRLILNYNTIGGVMADIHPNFVKRVKEFIPYMRKNMKEYHDLVTGNIIFQNRTKGVGVLSKEDAISFGCTGGTGRASGWHNDLRKIRPYAAYDRVQFNEVVRTEGDSFARYMIRLDEILESLNIIEQLIDNIPEGNFQEKMKPIIKLPAGTFFSEVEGSRGRMGVYIESKGDKTPYRLHYRSTGLPLVAVMDTACRNNMLADLIAIGGTVDYVVPDIDR